MKTTTLRILLIAMVAALALTMAGCKGESSPTAPPNTSTVPPGGVIPPTGATITLTVTPTTTPLVSSRVTVTATVTQNGQPVPDGTAVQFTTTLGTFTDTSTNTTIRTTTNGVATAQLSSSSPGAATITATVNNVSKTTLVTFSTQPVVPPPPNTTPTITSVCVKTGPAICTTPAVGIPAGGQEVVITGTNFRAPVRVLFDPGNGQPAKEAFVGTVTATEIHVTAPPFDIITGQTLPVTITVIDEAGTANEQKASLANAFTYQLAVLTPSVRTLTPSSGPIDGGTRVSILGDAFQAPVQVFFGAAEAQVVSVNFNEIVVMSPTARDTAPNASGVVTGPVNILVRNVGSGKEASFPAGFRYIAKAQITAVGPNVGSAFGGTRVTIDGSGFNDPLTVTLAGVAAQVIKVSGTQVIAISSGVPIPCQPPTGNVVVTNIDNGDQAQGPPYIYTPEIPAILSINPASGTPGTSTVVRVGRPGVGPDGTALIRIKLGDFTAVITPDTITDPFGPINFTAVVPNFNFTTEACTTSGGLAGTRLATPPPVDVSFLNVSTGCKDLIAKGFTIQPPGLNTCVATPTPGPPVASVTPSTFCPNGFGSVAVGGTNPQLFTIRNTAATGSASLNVSSITLTGADADQFTVSPTSATVPPGATSGVTVTFKPTTVGTKNANVVLVTNDPTQPTINICLQGTATP